MYPTKVLPRRDHCLSDTSAMLHRVEDVAHAPTASIRVDSQPVASVEFFARHDDFCPVSIRITSYTCLSLAVLVISSRPVQIMAFG